MLGRILNPVVVLTVAIAGLVAYSRLLWAMNLRPTATLVVAATVPGVVFLLTLWAIRAVQNTASVFYFALVIDWLIFAGSAVAAVLIVRRRHR